MIFVDRSELHCFAQENFGTQLAAVSLVRATPLSRPSRFRFDPVQAVPSLFPSEPRRPPRVKLTVLCGARSPTRPWSSSSGEPRSPHIHRVRRYYARLNVHFHGETTLYLGDIRRCNQKGQQQAAARPGDSPVPRRARAGAAQDRRFSPVCIPTAKSGA